jgi:hypothetical protein
MCPKPLKLKINPAVFNTGFAMATYQTSELLDLQAFSFEFCCIERKMLLSSYYNGY